MKTNLLKTAIIATFIILSSNVFSQIIIEETHTDCTCNQDYSGNIELTISGGLAPYNYDWTGPSGFTSYTQNIGGIGAGIYCVTVTDDNSDTETLCITITEPAPISITIDDSYNPCFGECDGGIYATVTGGDTSSITYQWPTATTEDISNLCAGQYALTVSDVCESVISNTITLTENPEIIITPTITNNPCYGDTLGSISLHVSGGTPHYNYIGAPPTYYYNWNSPPYPSDSIISNLSSNYQYYVTVTDDMACYKCSWFTLTDPDTLEITLDNIVNTTNGICNGSINTSATGGTSPYTFLWSTLSTDVTIFDLCPTNYGLTVTDANNCIVEDTFEIGSSYDASYTFVDTVDIAIDTCIFNNTLPVDSALIYNYQTINPDSIVLNWIFWQDGNSILLDIGVNLETQGSNLVYLEINCSNKATNTYSFYGTFDATTTGIQKMEVVNINIFPNPSTGIINIESNNIEQVEIYNTSGVLIKSTTTNKIDINEQAKGVYFVKVITTQGTITKRIILE